MAEMDPTQFSLMSLEEELTCSICLSTFDCPVTIPCGHNFCQDCLLATWKDSFSCPQCRTIFATKPELKKNTVLSTVVKTFNLRSSKSEADLILEEISSKPKRDVIHCDTCMEAEASNTCLTCMASYCEEHLRPHRENPIFRLHQLSDPVGDLSERICMDHHKLMEFFCSQHDRPICSICLQQDHKSCTFISPEEQRNLKESDLRKKLGLLERKVTKNEDVISQMTKMQCKLKEAADSRMKTLTADYQQMRDMLAQAERDALTSVERELETGQTKMKVLIKKFTENIDGMSKAKEDIHSLLSQSQTQAFLQASYDLPQATTFDPYTPRISLDSKKVMATQAFTAALKEHLTEIFKQPVETRLLILKPDEKAVPPSGSTGPHPESALASQPPEPQKQKKKPRSHSPGRPPMQPYLQTIPVPFFGQLPGWGPLPHAQGERATSGSGFTPTSPEIYQGSELQWSSGNLGQRPQSPPSQNKAAKKKQQKQPKKADNAEKKNLAGSVENLLDFGVKDKLMDCNPAAEFKEKPETTNIPLDVSTAEKRSELLKYATVLTLDPKTAHRRIALTEGFTKASVSDEQTDYPNNRERFEVCSQVLASKGFSRGRHYWEVKLSCNNFIGIGLAYNSIDRKGPTSRLGRNAQSWCVEWFNVKLSFWHNSSETVLVNPNSKRVGVLLDCETGTATFYHVADRAYPFYSFSLSPLAAAVYPAFWIFSSGSSVSLCKMQA